MKETHVNSTIVRSSFSAVLTTVECGLGRIVIYRHDREIGAVIGADELRRLRALPEEPPPLSSYEKKQLLFGVQEAARKRRAAQVEAQQALDVAKAGKDPLAAANAQVALDEATEAAEQANEEAKRGFDLWFE